MTLPQAYNRWQLLRVIEWLVTFRNYRPELAATLDPAIDLLRQTEKAIPPRSDGVE